MNPNQRHHSRISFLLLAAAGVVLLAQVAYLGMWIRTPASIAEDYALRRNEVLCLRAGADPYQVWCGRTPVPGFHRYDDPSARAADPAGHGVNCYTPWEYTFFLPLSFLPERGGYWAVQTFSLGLFVFLLAALGRRLAAISDEARDLVHSGLGFLLLYDNALMAALYYGNYGVLMACALGGLVWALAKKRDVTAGLCLAFLAMKPQIGALIAVPVLLSPRWRACVVAGIVCVLGSIWPWAACGIDPVTMVREVMASGQSYLNGGAFVNPFALPVFVTQHGGRFALWALMGGALAVVVGLALRFRKMDVDWFVRLAPAVVLNPLWTYSLQHDRVILWLPIFVMLGVFLSPGEPCRIRRTALGAVLGLWACALGRTALRVLAHGPLGTEHWSLLNDCGRAFELVLVMFAAVVLWIVLRRTAAEPPPGNA